MNRKFIYSFFALFIFALIWNAVVHLIILKEPELILSQIGRKADSRNFILSIIQTAGIIVIYIISYSKWNKTVNTREALKHGLFFSILAGLLVDVNQYVLYPLPLSLILLWFVFGTFEFCLYGIIINLILQHPRINK